MKARCRLVTTIVAVVALAGCSGHGWLGIGAKSGDGGDGHVCLNIVVAQGIVGDSDKAAYSNESKTVAVRADLWGANYTTGTHATRAVLQHLQDDQPIAFRYLLHVAVWHLVDGNLGHSESGIGAAQPESQAMTKDDLQALSDQLATTYVESCITTAAQWRGT